MRPALPIIALLLAGCSWSRFDDVQANAPVVLLDEPGGMSSGFGSAVASASTADDAHVLVAAAAGKNGAAEYRIGFGQSPVVDAIDSGHCKADCMLAETVAGLSSAAVPGAGTRSFCWMTGLSTAGVVGRCADATGVVEYALPVPPGVAPDPDRDLVLATDRGEPPALAAATSAGAAWFYPPLGTAFVELDTSSAGAGLASSIAVARAGAGRIVAIGAADAAQIWLYALAADDQSVASHGCVTGAAGFGRTLAAGDVDGDGTDELVVATDAAVVVLRGTELAGLAQGGACSAAGGAVLVELACSTTADVSDCSAGRFGDALSVGDLNGDGDGEVVVGAPGMRVRDAGRAGALLIYDVDLSGSADKEWLSDVKFVSSAESGDGLGSAIAAVRQADRDVLLAGAPGGDRAAMFYCFELPSGKRGSRCE